MRQKNQRLAMIYSGLAAVLVMGVIFLLSAQPAVISSHLSRGITAEIVKIAEKVMPGHDWPVIIYDELVRRAAHFFCYLVLGAVVANILGRLKIGPAKGLFLALIFCLLFAISDEMHQMYVPGRGAQLQDFMADGAGALLGIALFWLGKRVNS